MGCCPGDRCFQETSWARAAAHREAPPPAPRLTRPLRQKTPTCSHGPGTSGTSPPPLPTKGLQQPAGPQETTPTTRSQHRLQYRRQREASHTVNSR
ncbi:hypothetical protein NDU88_001044 [Pleurodeles waltl]|uniref:Uncharacterized protein n=1 Tax=Pleurodeles waltl TaxID=8319 RepID=A0AAV7MNU4_PLEWA|nr:hypothetical protein NDU88_001044 [Pleurodeles waltl]